MLSGGKLSQETIKEISGAPTGVEDLTRALNDLTPAGGGTWKGKFVGYDSDAFDGLRQRGPFAAQIYDPSESLGHFAIVDGLNSRGEVMIRDPWGEGTSYSVMIDTFLQYWTGLAVYQ